MNMGEYERNIEGGRTTQGITTDVIQTLSSRLKL